jgi:hypothetical protein
MSNATVWVVTCNNDAEFGTTVVAVCATKEGAAKAIADLAEDYRNDLDDLDGVGDIELDPSEDGTVMDLTADGNTIARWEAIEHTLGE